MHAPRPISYSSVAARRVGQSGGLWRIEVFIEPACGASDEAASSARSRSSGKVKAKKLCWSVSERGEMRSIGIREL